MASAGTVSVEFLAETKRFTSELKEVNSRLKGVGDGFASFGRIAATALGVFSAGAFTAFVKSAGEAADALGKTADKLGVSTQALKSFQVAAGEAGVGIEAANKLLTESQKRLGEAAAGTGEAAKYIKLLGLNVQELQQLSPDQLFSVYADSITSLSTRSEQLAAANALMGRSAQEAFSLIQGGSAAIDDAASFVERYGLALDRIEIKQIEQANDALGRIATVSETAGQRIAAGLAPAVEFFANRILEATGNTKGLQEAVEVFGSVAIASFEIVSNGVRSLQASFFGLATAGARAAQAITWGDVSKSFAASVDDNLTKANEALSKIKSIEQIQQTITSALEESRRKAEASVAAQATQDAAVRAGGVSIARSSIASEGDSIGLTEEQQLDAQLDVARAIAESQKEIERDLTRATMDELQQRSDAAENWRIFELQRNQNAAQTEISLRQQVTSAAMGALGLLANSSKTFAKIQKGIQIAEAIRNTYLGITNQLRSGDPYTAVARAAAVGVFGFAQVASIARTPEYGAVSFGGGAGSTSLPVSTGTSPAFSSGNQADAGRGAVSTPAVQVIVTGNVGFDERIIDQIVDGIRGATDGRDVMLFGPNSRQAQEIRGAA